MIDKVPKKLDIAGKERKRKEREQEGMIAIDSFPTPPPPQKKTNFVLWACPKTKMKHNYIQLAENIAENVENLFFSHFYASSRKWVQQGEIV